MGARILLPLGTDVEGIEVLVEGREKVGDGYTIEPVGTPIPLSMSSSEIPPVAKDQSVYSSDTPIPVRWYASSSVQSFRGYDILILKLNPVEYTPTSGSLYYYRSLRVEVTTKKTEGARTGLRGIPSDSEELSTWIDNPSVLSTYAGSARSLPAEYDMLIITPLSLVAAFQPLKEYHDTTGILTEIHTLQQIGNSDPHAIRDYIRQEFLNNGIDYVLLGADDDLIPALDMYCISFDRPDAPIEYDLPGDFYFSCLDGTFNFDGDALWAEPGDGDGGGEIDLLPEVHVGRVAADSPDEVTNVVNKTIAYLSANDAYLEKILLAGEQLNFGGMG
jgi:hypothetical protein